IRSDIGALFAAPATVAIVARARKPRFALSYSREIGRTYDGSCRPVKLGRAAKRHKPPSIDGWGQQSESVDRVQPVGQQESAFAPEQAVIGTCRQAALQVAEAPVSCSAVHGSPSSGQDVGQLAGGSQVSPAPMRPSGQWGAQSL